MNKSKITFQYVLISAAAVFITWILHEGAHWAMGEALGYNMTMNLNSVSLANGAYRNNDEHIVSAAGPMVTIIQAIVVFLKMQRASRLSWYPFLFVPLYMRILAGLLNFINLNDEGRISKAFGLGTFTLSIIVCGFLFYLVYNASRKAGYGAKLQWATVLLTMLFSSILVLADQFFNLRIIG
ncbi:MAG TPA: hypothetical protein VM843_06510 [Flavisolibacter sp.]|jgi:hypothetical protein|nr:hypothetical protein [Flavisolibacter sp.]